VDPVPVAAAAVVVFVVAEPEPPLVAVAVCSVVGALVVVEAGWLVAAVAVAPALFVMNTPPARLDEEER
jgi:H+/gluconate symporter-like permease